MKQSGVLLAGGDETLRGQIVGTLRRIGLVAVEATDLRRIEPIVQRGDTDLVIIVSCPNAPWMALEAARVIRRSHRLLPLILITANSSEDLAIAALRAGVNDYFKHPSLSKNCAASSRPWESRGSVWSRNRSPNLPRGASGGSFIY